jgi:hypothetical protein
MRAVCQHATTPEAAVTERSPEPDVDEDSAQVEPDPDDQFVGRVAGEDAGFAGETGAEARAAGVSENDPVEGGARADADDAVEGGARPAGAEDGTLT